MHLCVCLGIRENSLSMINEADFFIFCLWFTMIVTMDNAINTEATKCAFSFSPGKQKRRSSNCILPSLHATWDQFGMVVRVGIY